jgi:hypothetical protein
VSLATLLRAGQSLHQHAVGSVVGESGKLIAVTQFVPAGDHQHRRLDGLLA